MWPRRFLFAALAVLTLAAFCACASAARLVWDANTEPHLRGYKIHYGSASGQYTETVDVGNVTEWPIPDEWPRDRSYYFAATAYAECIDAQGQTYTCESGYSNEAIYSADAQPPAAATDVRVTWRDLGGPTMADPAFEAISTVFYTGIDGGDGGTVTFSTINAGDLVLVAIQRVSANAITGVTLGSQSMTQLKVHQSEASNFNLMVYGCIASSGGSNVVATASFSNTGGWLAMIGARYSGVKSATPLDSCCAETDCGGLTGASTSRYTNDTVTTDERALIVVLGTDWDNYNTHTAQNSYNKRFDNAVCGGGSCSAQFIFDKVADAGTFGGSGTGYRFSTAASDSWLAVMLAFEPNDAAATTSIPSSILSRQRDAFHHMIIR